MCTCKEKMKILIENHKKRLCYENTIFSNPPDTRLNIICSGFEKITIVKPVIEPMITESVIIENFVEEEEESPASGEETVELTDISPEELIEQEEEEKRIQDELALIQLTKLTKKKIRTKK